ncbi:class V aminotransferase (NifS-like) [Methanocella arvoryzae MRE50]|uniref:Cysteine desulfurase IscS n=2 Tax=Methanocella TaxID=570266 RepID=Q0W481_METAR|nr:class V aminotransferase (NifS-like) [Methanocella arvoryzae MRE50]
MTMKRVYLDNSATTKVSDEVVSAMLPYFTEKYGNPSSLHSAGREAREAVEAARARVADAIGASPAEIIFTSGGTESDNIAIIGGALANKKKGNHIITSAIEHPAVIETCRHLEKNGFKVTYVPVDQEGILRLDELEEAITPETTLITVMHVNNEIGTIQPIREIGKIAKEKDIYFHTDAVQAFGKVPVNVDDLGVDMLSLSSHKVHGPKGVGVLYLRRGTPVRSLVYGGGHEKGIRSGTENVAGIVGMGKACELAVRDFDRNVEQMTRLRDRLMDGLLKIDHSRLNGSRTKRSPNNVNISYSFVEGESMVLLLDMKGIEVSTGSACSSKKLEASHVLLSCGLDPETAHGSLRMTNSKYTTEEEIDYVIETLPGIVSRLREMSPLYKK